MPHSHHGHCEQEHEDLPGSGEQALLYSRIDRDNIRCLNESDPDTGKTIVKPWDQRFDNDKVYAVPFYVWRQSKEAIN
jgi:hypothetical protein